MFQKGWVSHKWIVNSKGKPESGKPRQIELVTVNFSENKTHSLYCQV